MRFHDYHLSKYEVSDFGETISLHLIFDYRELKRDESVIRFSSVALHHFIHVGTAILLDIEEISISDLLNDWGSEIAEWHRLHGVRLWQDSLQNYSLRLQTEGFKAWRIESSIGFYGFVIAKSVANA